MHEVEKPEIVLRSQSGWIPVDWRELIATRELFLTMILRDIQVRYKQTVLGVGWAVLQPLASMIVFASVFSQLLPGIDTQGVIYPLFIYSGMVPWTFFSNAVNAAAVSAVTQQHLISKIYFPRVYAPTAPVGAVLLDMVVAFLLFTLLFPFYHVTPSWQIVFVPILMLLTFMAAIGVGLTSAALVILFRDFRYIVVFAVQILFYLTPVLFPATYYKKYAPILAINPMFGLIDAYRSAIFGVSWNPLIVGISAVSAVVMFLIGIYFFRRVERYMADIL